jgi:ribosomal protein S18 acetylase RimI-like enzyme
MQDEFFHPPSSGVVYAGDHPVGFITGGVYPHDFEDRGRTEGWIERIGTVAGYRGRGLATALLTRAMLAFRTDGLDFAVLGADSENETGAMSLYERLGFVAEKRAIAYVKPIPD